MDLSDVLDLVPEDVDMDSEEEQPVQALDMLGIAECVRQRRGRKDVRAVNRKGWIAKRKHVKVKQLHAQVLHFNRQGIARAQDHVMLAPAAKRRGKVRGQSGWRRWTPEAILKCAEANPLNSQRGNAPDGGSHAAACQSLGVYAGCVVAGQDEGLKAIVANSRERELRFFYN